MPKVSVVLPVYNGEAFLGECLDSLLAQSLKDFEVLLINDASTDSSQEICQQYQSRDKRIRYIENSTNLGTASTTNLGHRLAQGDYIAHADQDDISEPQRLGWQVNFLKNNPSICMASGQMRAFGSSSGALSAPQLDADIKTNFLPAMHNLFNPTIMIRKSFIEEHALSFDPIQKGAADYGFFVNSMCRGGKFANLPKTLLSYRSHSQQQSGNRGLMEEITSGIRRQVLNEFFPELNQPDVDRVEPLLRWLSPPSLPVTEVEAGLDVLPRLLSSNTSRHGESREQRDGFLQACQRRWSDGIQQLRS
ncbi:glycosyltransferase [Pseudomonas sp. GD04087]|uniref:glycosyltransferase family 2 protein n=1 Tax=unclassified Pseudomonas TaxID=196821 RepID=UPI00244775E2|nr:MULTISPECIES: glycosyltransferase [unclassified Pseudomonas]MDH0292547.1 glycosyltransferase [Pseudomonas sp. GD04087]MDH1052772.1 glycosyltransferase [Pseudomonas sp. GD03903]MDH2001670.1 glycosyltransferase [Pseudomonas sp. GD03691]